MSTGSLRLISVDGVLAEVGVARSTFDDWRASRLVPRLLRLPNNDLRMRVEDLRAWLLDGLPHPLPTMSIAQAAREIRLSLSSFEQMLAAGDVPGAERDLRFYGRIRRSTFDAWLDSLPKV